MKGAQTSATATEREVLKHLLDRGVSRAVLYAKIRTAPPARVDEAIDVLLGAGVIRVSGGALSPSDAVRFALGLLA